MDLGGTGSLTTGVLPPVRTVPALPFRASGKDRMSVMIARAPPRPTKSRAASTFGRMLPSPNSPS